MISYRKSTGLHGRRSRAEALASIDADDFTSEASARKTHPAKGGLFTPNRHVTNDMLLGDEAGRAATKVTVFGANSKAATRNAVSRSKAEVAAGGAQ